MTGAELHHSLRKSPRLFVLAVCLFVLPAALAIAAPTELRYDVRSWQTDDGLPQNSVYALAQTRDGFLWVGTHEGLVRFDGLHFLPVGLQAAPEFQRAWITALYVARDGGLWVAADQLGVFRLRPGEVTHLTEADGLGSNQPRCFFETSDGSLWIGTEAGLSRWRDGKLTNLTQREGLGDNSIRGLCQDRQGSLRVATKRGLSTVTPDGKVTGTLDLALNWVGNALRCVALAHDGTLWVGSTDGLSHLGVEGRDSLGSVDGLPDRVINSVTEDDLGQLWVGTYHGLARVSHGRVLPRPSREPIYDDLIYAMCQDHEGSLWVGGRDGLYRLTPARFTTYTSQDGLTGNNATSVLEDASGTLWVGLWDGGLDALRGGQITGYAGPSNSLPRDSVLSLSQSRTGGLWLGLEAGGGLQRFENGNRLPVGGDSRLLNNAILCIHEDRQGAVWVGTSSGLSVLRKGTNQVFTATNGLSGRVQALCEDSSGAMWVGTDAGLLRCLGGKFTTFTTREGLSHNVVSALYEDRQHILWIGTHGGGLNRFQDGRFRAFTSREGLFSDDIYELVEDDCGFFWLTCRRGLFRIAREQFEQVARGELSALTCTAFGRADGLLSVQFNGVAKPAGWKGRDGQLWFPTIRGVVSVDSHLGTNEKPPPVVLEEVVADRKHVGAAPGRTAASASENAIIEGWPLPLGPQVLRIPAGRGELEFRWAALSLQAPEKNRFKYMLEGVDTAWQEVGPERSAHYNSVAPGSYRFRVFGCNNDGVWNPSDASVALVLLPHFWQTWWLKACALLVLALLLTLVYRVRVARLRELERLRVEIAANLHDDVGARLTKVAMLTESVEQETPAADPKKAHIQAIARTTGEVLQAMDEIVWTINPKNDTLENLANYIFQYAQEYFQDTGVRCRLDMPAQLPDCAISTDVRHSVFMVVKEALNNVLKHSRASEVRISMAVGERRITLGIADNGRGFRTETSRSTGNGLDNMRQRVEQLGGIFRLVSAPGEGTRIAVEFESA